MPAAAKLAAFGLAVAVTAGAGWLIGGAVGPIAAEPPPRKMAAHGGETGETGAHGDEAAGHGGEVKRLPGGLASAQDGYTFAAVQTTLPAGRERPFRFRILGPDGEPVTRFDVEHEKRLHLIVVRRDTAGFQHIHPELGSGGVWSVPLRLAQPGSYRAFADFKPAGGESLTLGVDLDVAGSYRPSHYEVSRVSTVDGYQVRLSGELTAGHTSDLTLTVTRGGKPVTDLQPYLGANGHLVALRQGDLAYLHVHPEDSGGSGPEIGFAAEVPSAGGYRLFLDFKHGGRVHTAQFTVEAS